MATPTLTQHALPGALGEILVDVRAGSRTAAQPAVLLVHGFKGFKDFAFLPVLADRLAREGFLAITVSVSGCGVDGAGDFSRLERFAHNTYSKELDDLHVVVDALRRGDLATAAPSSLGVLGHSRGGGMALLLTQEIEWVAAVVTWNAIGRARRHTDRELAAWRAAGTIQIPHARLKIRLPLSFDVAADCLAKEDGRLDIPAAASGLARPWLQVHGTNDETVPFAEAEELARVAGTGHELLAIEGGAHTFGASHPWQGSTAHLDRALEASVAFLGRHLD
jgi:dienelactone hydrolase